jgi:hypothetical protein
MVSNSSVRNTLPISIISLVWNVSVSEKHLFEVFKKKILIFLNVAMKVSISQIKGGGQPTTCPKWPQIIHPRRP